MVPRVIVRFEINALNVRRTSPATPARPRPAPADSSEPLVQISFSARASTRKAMFQIAHDRDMTLKAIILDALKKARPSLDITEDDLIDKRR